MEAYLQIYHHSEATESIDIEEQFLGFYPQLRQLNITFLWYQILIY